MASPRSTIPKSEGSPNGRADGAALATVAILVHVDELEPNPWNPNVMDEAMFKKELTSIRKFGFVDPLTIRELPNADGHGFSYQIIDGEHRWKAASQLGYTELPCWNLGAIPDADAEELTIVLNETRGKSNEERLKLVLEDLVAKRGDESVVREIMPFSRARFDEIMGKMSVDWDALERRRVAFDAGGRWKELVFRMPQDAAKVVQEAIDAVKETEGFDDDWKALEMICADSLA